MNFSPRFARLQADHDRLMELARINPVVHVLHKTGTPPEQYWINLRCKSVQKVDEHYEPVFSFDHHLKITLPPQYPRQSPEFKMLSPIWHPNIGFSETSPVSVCIGDTGDHGYAPSMGLDDLVLRIIEMLRYRNYGTQRPLNGLAAEWAVRRHNLFPLE